MGVRAVVEFVTGPARSGKSYSQCARWLIDEFLPRREGRHWSNFPIKFEPWTDVYGVEQPGLLAIARERLGLDEDEVRDRVRVIGDDEMKKWRNLGWGGSGRPYGPWNTFQGVDLSGCCISIDEIHNFCPDRAAKSLVQEWTAWLGELGHEGCTAEFLSQDESKVNDCIHREAEIRYELLNNDRKSDPLFGIRNYYWRQLARKCGLKWPQTFWKIEYRRVMGKWVRQKPDKYVPADVSLYGVYDSNAHSVAGGKRGAGSVEESKLFGWGAFARWFILDNGFQLGTRGGILAAVLYGYLNADALAASAMGYLPGRLGATPSKVAAVEAAAPGRRAAVPNDQVRGKLKELGVKAPAVDDADAQTLLSMAQRVSELADQVELAEGWRAADRERIEQLEKELSDANALVAISGNGVVFRGGERYRIGEVIESGPYDGLVVESINYDRRTATLGGGRVVRMAGRPAGVPLSGPSVINSIAAGLPRSLSGIGGGSTNEPPPGSSSAPSAEVSDRRHADGRILSDARK